MLQQRNIPPPTPPPGFKVATSRDLDVLYEYLSKKPHMVLSQIIFKSSTSPRRPAKEFVDHVEKIESDKTGKYIVGTGKGRHSGKEVNLRIADDCAVELRMPNDFHDGEWYEPDAPAKTYIFIPE